MRGVVLIAALVACLGVVNAFYLPGVYPQEFEDGQDLKLKVNKLTSTKTQLPYSYYDLPFCPPEEGVKDYPENLGEVLRGDKIQNSRYKLKMNVDQSCVILCDQVHTKAEMEKFASFIRNEYRVNWILDNLPAVTKVYEVDVNGLITTAYERGFPVGYVSDSVFDGTEGTPYVFNHIKIFILHHFEGKFEGKSRIVGFEVEPFSILHELDTGSYGDNIRLRTCNPNQLIQFPSTEQHQPVVDAGKIFWTYDVAFQLSSVKWASRWDQYLKVSNEQIHWFSIVNSLMIVFFLTGMVAMIMMRTLHQDIGRYNQQDREEAQEESGWKLVHGDVFRPPSAFGLFSVFVGSGTQVIAMMFILMIFAMLGFLSPANRGSLYTAMVLLFFFCGCFAGYNTTRNFKMFKGQNWKAVTVGVALLLPGLIFVVFFFLDLILWYQQSTAAIPFTTMIFIFFLWSAISLPLVFIGSYFGFKKPALEQPVRTNQIPRQIPDQAWYMSTFWTSLTGGVLPFGAVFIELYFILSSIWLHQYYYVFGFLFLVFCILVITCSEISIVMVYFQLCSEDYHWWWRSFWTSASSGLYLFLYSIFYFNTKLEITIFSATVLYFGYMFMLSLFFALMTGAIGFYATLYFVRKIYGSVKVD